MILEPLVFPSGDSLSFRIEIQRSVGEPTRYRTDVHRVETFQMHPSFPDASRTSTEFVVIQDNSYGGGDAGSSADEVLEATLAALRKPFASAPPSDG